MIYVSDHGESLGESGLYLHGLPNMLAPDTQKHVPLIMWFSESFDEHVKIDVLKANIRKRLSHDNIFHTILGLMEIESDIYDDKMDIINHIDEHDE